MDLFLCLQFPRADVKSHSQTHIESHLNFALRGLEATQHQVHELVTIVDDQSQQIERQSQHIKRQSQQVDRQSQQIERQSQQIERQSQQIERLISKDKEQSEKMERLICSPRDQPPQTDRHGPINQIFPTPFEWKIPNIQNVVLNAESLLSEPFYLCSIGYKYLLKIEIDRLELDDWDDWDEWDQWLEVKIKLVSGEFDDLLSWPCKEKVRVSLVDQDSKTLRITKVIDFDNGKKPCSRPRRDDHHDYRHIFRGEVDVLRRGSVTKNDTILIRVNRE